MHHRQAQHHEQPSTVCLSCTTPTAAADDSSCALNSLWGESVNGEVGVPAARAASVAVLGVAGCQVQSQTRRLLIHSAAFSTIKGPTLSPVACMSHSTARHSRVRTRSHAAYSSTVCQHDVAKELLRLAAASCLTARMRTHSCRPTRKGQLPTQLAAVCRAV